MKNSVLKVFNNNIVVLKSEVILFFSLYSL